MSNIPAELDFSDIDFISVPVTLRGGKKYTLRTASEEQCRRFDNERSSRMIFDQNGKVAGVRDSGDMRSLLVQMCLRGENDRPVNMDEVRNMHPKVVANLFETAKKISGIDERDTEQEDLQKALQRSDSPVRLEDFRNWVNSLGDEFKSVKRLLKPSREEEAKNEQSDSIAT